MRRYAPRVVLILYLLAGCTDKGSDPVKANALDVSIDKRTLELGQDEKFSLELDVQADGGYQWDYQISDTTVVALEDRSYRPKSGQWLDGGLTVETFHFRTGRSGGSVVRLRERRVWEMNVPPIHTVEFTVLVK